MSMSVTQVRLPDGITKQIDEIVKKGDYSSKSDVIRDAVRYFLEVKKIESIHDLIGTMPNSGDSVKEIRELRKKLSKEPVDLDEINALGE